MKTQREALVAALKARHHEAVQSRSTRFAVFAGIGGKNLYVGKAGALRAGPTASASVPVPEAFRQALLIEGGYVAADPPANLYPSAAVNDAVFVYGTLKSGYWNCDRFMKTAKFVGTARTVPSFHVRDVGFPIAFLTGPETHPVSGEVWIVDRETLANLDRLEGVPHHYTRKIVRTTMAGSNRPAFAWMYVQKSNSRDDEFTRECPVVDGAYVWSASR